MRPLFCTWYSIEAKMPLPFEYCWRYESAVKFIDTIDVGSVEKMVCLKEDCMCATASFADTLRRLLQNPFYFDKLWFPSMEQQIDLFQKLKLKEARLYQSLGPPRRTLFVRESGGCISLLLFMKSWSVPFSFKWQMAGSFPQDYTFSIHIIIPKFKFYPSI